MKKTKYLSLIFLVLFCSSCGHVSSRVKREPQKAEARPQAETELKKSEPVHETPREHEAVKEIKLFPPLTDDEAEYYRKLFKDSHVEIRLAAASVLMSHGDRSGEPILLELVKGKDIHFRLDSFLELTERPTRKLIPELQSAIEKEKDMMARFVMKRALKKAQQKLEEYEKEAPSSTPR